MRGGGGGNSKRPRLCFFVGGKCKQVWSEKAPIRPPFQGSSLVAVRCGGIGPGRGRQSERPDFPGPISPRFFLEIRAPV